MKFSAWRDLMTGSLLDPAQPPRVPEPGPPPADLMPPRPPVTGGQPMSGPVDWRYDPCGRGPLDRDEITALRRQGEP